MRHYQFWPKTAQQTMALENRSKTSQICVFLEQGQPKINPKPATRNYHSKPPQKRPPTLKTRFGTSPLVFGAFWLFQTCCQLDDRNIKKRRGFAYFLTKHRQTQQKASQICVFSACFAGPTSQAKTQVTFDLLKGSQKRRKKLRLEACPKQTSIWH